MAASIRMDDALLQRLKQYAQAHEVSASLVVREALVRYLDAQQQTPHELGEHLFGRHGSNDAEAGQRSRTRKQRMRDHMHAKHDRA